MENNSYKKRIVKMLKGVAEYAMIFLRWLALGLALGAAGGLLGGGFSLAIGWAATLRQGLPWIIWLLPVGGLLIAWLYHLDKLQPADTNGVLRAIHTPASITYATGPVIFVSSVISHLLGASVGREGAALQMGGTMGQLVGKLLKMDERDTTVVVMCGMSAVFSALFGTPVTAAIFAMEVASVGILHFSAIVPCVASAIMARHIAALIGAKGELFSLPPVSELSVGLVAGVIAVAVAGAVVSIFYCEALHKGTKVLAKLLPNPYLRIFCGGLTVAVLTWMIGTTDYNGAGIKVISAAVGGSAAAGAFAIKLVFTVISVAAGYKGGEIVPAMFIGSTMGCAIAPLVGIDPAIGAAIGLVSLFCGSLNCPISSIFLGVELFGGDYLPFFAATCAVSYMLSANFGLYREQKLVYSKLRPEFINRFTEE